MSRSNNRLILHDHSSTLNSGQKGAYILVLSVTRDATTTVGRLGAMEFAAGAYAYVGSALGRAGFGRIRRHLRVFSGSDTKLKWHIDYLSDIAALHSVLAIATTKRIECDIAKHLQASPSLTAIRYFGASDCGCNTHLFYSPDIHDLGRELKKVGWSFDTQVTCWKLPGAYAKAQRNRETDTKNLQR